MLHAARRLAPALAAATLVLAAAPSAMADGGPDGAVYALTNAAAGNAVVAYDRASDGSYTPVANLSEIAGFAIGADGALSARPSVSGTPAGLAGLAAF